jgi:hypothetical protein
MEYVRDLREETTLLCHKAVRKTQMLDFSGSNVVPLQRHKILMACQKCRLAETFLNRSAFHLNLSTTAGAVDAGSSIRSSFASFRIPCVSSARGGVVGLLGVMITGSVLTLYLVIKVS